MQRTYEVFESEFRQRLQAEGVEDGEEAALVAALGDPYREYMRRTRRLVPFLF